jgi:hypothetical protein
MTIPIELSESQAQKLRGEAQRLGVEPHALAAAAVIDLLSRQAPDFELAAEYVVQKDRELYERLKGKAAAAEPEAPAGDPIRLL